jgi:septal ring-binding cell division protein DamX
VGQRNLRYVVVSGPFKSRAEAERFAASQGLPPNPWLRTVGSLQDVLPRAAATKR